MGHPSFVNSSQLLARATRQQRPASGRGDNSNVLRGPHSLAGTE